VVSQPAEIRRRPSGCQAKSWMRSVCPRRAPSERPLPASQRRTTRSSPAVARRPPSLLNATALIGHGWPRISRTSCCPAGSHSRVTPSSCPVANSLPSLPKATAVTQHGCGRIVKSSPEGTSQRDRSSLAEASSRASGPNLHRVARSLRKVHPSCCPLVASQRRNTPGSSTDQRTPPAANARASTSPSVCSRRSPNTPTICGKRRRVGAIGLPEGAPVFGGMTTVLAERRREADAGCRRTTYPILHQDCPAMTAAGWKLEEICRCRGNAGGKCQAAQYNRLGRRVR